MIHNNQGQNRSDQYNDADDVNSSLGNAGQEQQNQSSGVDDTIDEQDNPLTQSSDDDESKEQSATNATDKNRNIATSYHDNQRATSRANEATDRLDSGSGGLSSGGVKSATDY